MITDVADVVGNLVQSIDYTLTGELNVDVLPNVWVTCNLKWARVGKIVIDPVTGNSFTIVEILENEGLILEALPTNPTNEPAGNMLYLPNPFYLSGTKIAANSEWSKVSNSLMAKTPVVWLLELIRFKSYGRESTIDFESDLRLFFLDETNVTQFYTSDHRSNVVSPMTELASEFINTIGSLRQFKTVDQYEIITFSRFGVEQDQGVFKNILDANLSGVELRLTLTKYKQNCKC
jgi:hypothetical protein